MPYGPPGRTLMEQVEFAFGFALLHGMCVQCHDAGLVQDWEPCSITCRGWLEIA